MGKGLGHKASLSLRPRSLYAVYYKFSLSLLSEKVASSKFEAYCALYSVYFYDFGGSAFTTLFNMTANTSHV